MNLSRTLVLCAVVAVSLVSLQAQARVGLTDPDAVLCRDAARQASDQTGVPFDVLMALTLTETGRKWDGMFQPWPWALNEGGNSNWFDDRDQAFTYLENAIATGTTNIDVGCFQLNYRWHGAAFTDLDDMMNPNSNALYAARLMLRLSGDAQDWVAAAGAYHSSTPDVAERYLARFKPIYAGLSESPLSLATVEVPGKDNGFPLFRPGGTRSAGSIVPIAGSTRRLIGGP